MYWGWEDYNMALEMGGKADKDGNRYEYNWVLSKLLDVIEGNATSIVWEPVGADADGVDVMVVTEHNNYHQCKVSNGNKDQWSIRDLATKNILSNWKDRLSENETNEVTLVSPITFRAFSDLANRARNSSNDGQEFYDYQVTSKEDNSLYAALSDKLIGGEFDYIEDEKIRELNKNNKLLSYLQRINFEQINDSDIENRNKERIYSLFLSDKNDVYDYLLSQLIQGDNYSHPIDSTIIMTWLRNKEFQLRNLANDNQTIGKIEMLNTRFTNSFKFWDKGFIERDCYADCYELIKGNTFTVIHGEAGVGKSGLLYYLTEEYKKHIVPYLAIKLDEYSPEDSLNTWSKNKLDLPINCIQVLHLLYPKKSAVLILDQVDTMRWAADNNAEAYAICRGIVNEINLINKVRPEHPIKLVIVSRTYDLNHHDILAVICKDFVPFELKTLTSQEVRAIVGISFDSPNTERLLNTFFNIYLWQQISNSDNISEIKNQANLIYVWIEHIKKSIKENNDVSSPSFEDCISLFNDLCKGRKQLRVPKIMMDEYADIMGYLESIGLFIIDSNNKYAYVHQIIFDYMMSKEMLKQVYSNASVESIIGSLDTQDPWKRYQIYMMLEQLYNDDPEEFLAFGIKLLGSSNVRFYIKHLFFEIICRPKIVHDSTRKYIIDHFFDTEWGKYLQTAVQGNLFMIEQLVVVGVLDRLCIDNVQMVIRILRSTYTNSSDICSKFINGLYRNGGLSLNDLFDFIYFPIENDCVTFRALRLEFYKENWNNVVDSINIDELIQSGNPVIVDLLALGIINDSVYSYNKKTYPKLSKPLSADLLDRLIDLLPKDIGVQEALAWCDRFNLLKYKRVLVEVIKSSLTLQSQVDESITWKCIEKLKSFNSIIANEIILFAFKTISSQYSDSIFEYLIEDIDMYMFDYTSSSETYLDLVKNVIQNHFASVEECIFDDFVNKVIRHYCILHIRSIHKERIGNRKDDNIKYSYLGAELSYWGQFQYEILSVLPYDSLSTEIQSLVNQLKRKFPNGVGIFTKGGIKSGFVRSSIHFDKLSKSAWTKLLSNVSIDENRKKRQKFNNEFIENTSFTINGAFANKFEHDLLDMIDVIKSCGQSVNQNYIETVIVKLTDDKCLVQLSDEQLISFLTYIINTFKDKTCECVKYILDIILKRPELYHFDNIKQFIDGCFDSSYIEIADTRSVLEEIESRNYIMAEYNTAKGRLIELSCTLLCKQLIGFVDYENRILSILSLATSFDKYLYFYYLISGYSIDAALASKVMKYLVDDSWLVNNHYGAPLLVRLYDAGYIPEILSVINQCYNSDDDNLIQIASYTIMYLYIHDNTSVRDYMENVDLLSKNARLFHMMEEANIYWSYDEYRDKVKAWYLFMRNQGMDISQGISRLFIYNYIELERDQGFVNDIFSHEFNGLLVRKLGKLLQVNKNKLMIFSDLILNVISYIIEHKDNYHYWDINQIMTEILASLYEGAISHNNNEIKSACLDCWDDMYQYQLGSIRDITDSISR